MARSGPSPFLLLTVLLVVGSLPPCHALLCGDGQFSCPSLLDLFSCCPCSQLFPSTCSNCEVTSTCCTSCDFGWAGCLCDMMMDFDGFCVNPDDDSLNAHCECLSFETIGNCSNTSYALTTATLTQAQAAASIKGIDAVVGNLWNIFSGKASSASASPTPTQAPPTPTYSAIYVAFDLSSQSANILKSWLVTYGPLSFSIDMGDVDTSGQWATCSNCNNTTDHVVTLMGWTPYTAEDGTESFMWIVQNSWATSFGDDGLFYLRVEDCTMFFSVGPMFNTLSAYGFAPNNTIPPSLNDSDLPAKFSLSSQGAYGNSSAICSPPVLDQYQCGSCYAFSATINFATTLCLFFEPGIESFLSVSPQFSLNLMFNLNFKDPCDGGWPYQVLDQLATTMSTGFATCTNDCTQGCMPYTEQSCLEDGNTDKPYKPEGAAVASTMRGTSRRRVSGGSDRSHHHHHQHRQQQQHQVAHHLRHHMDDERLMKDLLNRAHAQGITPTALLEKTVGMPGGISAIEQDGVRGKEVKQHVLAMWHDTLAGNHSLHNVDMITEQVVNGYIYNLRGTIYSQFQDGSEQKYFLDMDLYRHGSSRGAVAGGMKQSKGEAAPAGKYTDSAWKMKRFSSSLPSDQMRQFLLKKVTSE